jgi:hypothetical protein
MSRRLQMLWVGVVAAAFFACGDGGVGKTGDVVGGPCTADSCAGGSTCLIDTMHPGGTCTIACTSQADCPDGTVCVQESGGTCLLACSTASDCRDGYGCNVKSTLPAGSDQVCIR